MQEIQSRSPLVQAVQEAGHSLVPSRHSVLKLLFCDVGNKVMNNIHPSQVKGRHFAWVDIRDRLEELEGLHRELLTEAERKGKLLQEALTIHSFLSEVRAHWWTAGRSIVTISDGRGH